MSLIKPVHLYSIGLQENNTSTTQLGLRQVLSAIFEFHAHDTSIEDVNNQLSI